MNWWSHCYRRHHQTLFTSYTMKDELATGLWEILIELLIVSIIIELSLSLCPWFYGYVPFNYSQIHIKCCSWLWNSIFSWFIFCYCLLIHCFLFLLVSTHSRYPSTNTNTNTNTYAIQAKPAKVIHYWTNITNQTTQNKTQI